MAFGDTTESNQRDFDAFEEVYAADYVGLPVWSGIVLEVHRETQGELREGDRFTTIAKFLGRRFEMPMEVTSHAPPRRHSDRSTGGPFEQEYAYERAEALDLSERCFGKPEDVAEAVLFPSSDL